MNSKFFLKFGTKNRPVCGGSSSTYSYVIYMIIIIKVFRGFHTQLLSRAGTHIGVHVKCPPLFDHNQMKCVDKFK
jgi:hypothetical protein